MLGAVDETLLNPLIGKVSKLIVTSFVSVGTVVEMLVPPKILSVSVVDDAVAVPSSLVTLSNKFCVLPTEPLKLIVSVSSVTSVVIFVPPATVNVSFWISAVVVPVSPVTVV